MVFNLEKRVKKVFSNLQRKVDIIVVKNSSEPYLDHNFFYVTGLEMGFFEGCAAVLFSDGRVDLVVSELESENVDGFKGDVFVYKKEKEFEEILKKCLRSYTVIGLNFDGVLYNDFLKFKKLLPGREFLDVSDGFVKSRMIKDEYEIEFIREACRIVDKVMREIPGVLRSGMREYELAGEINYLLQKNGADKPAFDTISSFAGNTAIPHYSHGDVKLKEGDLVLCDFGACFKRYNSDITRVFVFGKANEKQKKMHEVVLQAQEIGFEKICEGVKGKMVHNAVEGFIDESEFKGCFIHSTGHSLGLGVHDGGIGLTSDVEGELKENMVLTVEPGVYIPGFGGVRIEDDILVKNDGIDILTKSSRELIEI